MRVGHHQLHPAEAARLHLAKERRSEDLVRRVTNLEAEHLPAPVGGDISQAAVKAGLVDLTLALAGDGAGAASAVARGWIANGFPLPPEALDGAHLPSEALDGAHLPPNRSSTADAVAAAIVWLASRSASSVTGQANLVDGGNCVTKID